jgi:hypothetical protein
MALVCEAPATDGRTPLAGFSTRGQIIALTCACAGASAFLFAVDPNRHAVYPQCLLYKATGLYCAGCGATRALYALLHGRLFEALHDNALFVAALPFLLAAAGWYLSRAWILNAWPKREIPARTLLWRGTGIFLVLLLFMIARNLPGLPFDLLRPI